MTFDFESLRFSFLARGAILFPAVVPANILRGALGSILRKQVTGTEYARVFSPTMREGGPSGLRDQPRPFCFRARHLDGRTVQPGEHFHFDVNVFDSGGHVAAGLKMAFAQFGRQGLGPARGLADLEDVQTQRISLDLAPGDPAISAVRVTFLTATELKGGGGLAARPEFPVLLARIRDRLSTLRTLYGSGSVDIDFTGMASRAAKVQLNRCEIEEVRTTRRSSRTGQEHRLQGFTGTAEYCGPLTEFLPFLEAARWTGVGRQTVWGKGELGVTVINAR